MIKRQCNQNTDLTSKYNYCCDLQNGDCKTERYPKNILSGIPSVEYVISETTQQYNVPEGYTIYEMELIGGGGGGAGSAGVQLTNLGGSGGGGGSGQIRIYSMPLRCVKQLNITIGAGGTAGTGTTGELNGNDGTDGGNTIIKFDPVRNISENIIVAHGGCGGGGGEFNGNGGGGGCGGHGTDCETRFQIAYSYGGGGGGAAFLFPDPTLTGHEINKGGIGGIGNGGITDINLGILSIIANGENGQDTGVLTRLSHGKGGNGGLLSNGDCTNNTGGVGGFLYGGGGGGGRGGGSGGSHNSDEIGTFNGIPNAIYTEATDGSFYGAGGGGAGAGSLETGYNGANGSNGVVILKMIPTCILDTFIYKLSLNTMSTYINDIILPKFCFPDITGPGQKFLIYTTNKFDQISVNDANIKGVIEYTGYRQSLIDTTLITPGKDYIANLIFRTYVPTRFEASGINEFTVGVNIDVQFSVSDQPFYMELPEQPEFIVTDPNPNKNNTNNKYTGKRISNAVNPSTTEQTLLTNYLTLHPEEDINGAKNVAQLEDPFNGVNTYLIGHRYPTGFVGKLPGEAAATFDYNPILEGRFGNEYWNDPTKAITYQVRNSGSLQLYLGQIQISPDLNQKYYKLKCKLKLTTNRNDFPDILIPNLLHQSDVFLELSPAPDNLVLVDKLGYASNIYVPIELPTPLASVVTTPITNGQQYQYLTFNPVGFALPLTVVNDSVDDHSIPLLNPTGMANEPFFRQIYPNTKYNLFVSLDNTALSGSSAITGTVKVDIIFGKDVQTGETNIIYTDALNKYEPSIDTNADGTVKYTLDAGSFTRVFIAAVDFPAKAEIFSYNLVVTATNTDGNIGTLTSSITFEAPPPPNQ